MFGLVIRYLVGAEKMVGLQNYWERNQRVLSELEGRSRLLPFWTERQIKKLQMKKKRVHEE
jgi:hypothetical protein